MPRSRKQNAAGVARPRNSDQVPDPGEKMRARNSRKHSASQMVGDKENRSPADDSGSEVTGLGVTKSQQDDARDGEPAECLLAKNNGETSAQTPGTPPSKVMKPGIRDPRTTPGRKVPPRRPKPNAFRPETDSERMRNPMPLPPPAKKRMNGFEKDKRYKQEALEDPNHMFRDLYVCYKKGPRGSSAYNQSGFQLDYKKVAEWMKPKAYNKRSIMVDMDKHLEKAKRERVKIMEILFRNGTAPIDSWPREEVAWKDRVSKDLDIPCHKIDIAAFEKWERRGFEKQWPSDWDMKWFSEEEKNRLVRLLEGASLRK